MPSHFHQYGGRDLARQEHVWPGLGYDRVRWRAEDGSTGLTRRPEHQLFVTLAGSTGRTRAWIDGGERYDGVDFPGATTFIPASRHRRASYRGGTIEYVALRLDPELLTDQQVTEFVGFTNRPDPLIHRLVLSLDAEARMAGVASRLFVDSVATTLLLHLLRTASDLAPRRTTGPAALGPSAVGRVIEYIDQHLADDLRLEVLAAIAGTERTRFSRAFKAATGTSPHRYVTDRRLDSAARLLLRPGGPHPPRSPTRSASPARATSPPSSAEPSAQPPPPTAPPTSTPDPRSVRTRPGPPTPFMRRSVRIRPPTLHAPIGPNPP